MSQRPWFKIISVTLACALVATAIPVSAAPAPGALSGGIFAAGGKAPVTGAIIHATDPKSGTLYSSTPSSADGSFRIGDVPAGTYELGIQAGREMYLVRTPVTLAPGQTRTVNLALDPATTAQADDDDKDKGGMTGWNNPLVASLLVVGSAIVLGVVIDEATDDDEPASPSAPATN